MRAFRGWLAGLLVIASPAGSNGDAADDAALREERSRCAVAASRAVQDRYESVEDLSARFEQRTRSVALGVGSAAESTESSGRVFFAKPGRMRWEYETPRPSLVVSDGAVMWLFDPDSREAQRLRVTGSYLTGAALSFLLGTGQLEDEFLVTADECTAAIARLVLTPRKEASYERLGLEVSRENGEVRSTAIHDLFGNVTEVAFTDLETNGSPPVSTFQFEPPAGTRVIDLANEGPLPTR